MLTNLKKLAEIIRVRQEDLMAVWRSKVREVPAARRLDRATLDNHIRVLLDQLAEALLRAQQKPLTTPGNEGQARNHGLSRFHEDFSLTELVAEYNALRDAIQEFAEANRISIAGRVNMIVNRTLDKAIAVAVQAFSEHKTLEIQKQREEHLSFVVHDLRTPLAAISTAAKIIDQALPTKDERVSRMMGIVHRNATRLNALISSVLQQTVNVYSAAEGRFPAKIERREFDLWPVIEELAHDVQPLAEPRGVRIKSDVPNDCVVFADPTLLTQVFQNLLSNAIDHTTNGEIIIAAQSKPEGGVHCWVRDTGEGIPEDRIGKIFDKLESDPRKKGGLGLGLAVVKQIVEAHGGQITVASKPGQGSIFDFYLPSGIDVERAS